MHRCRFVAGRRANALYTRFNSTATAAALKPKPRIASDFGGLIIPTKAEIEKTRAPVKPEPTPILESGQTLAQRLASRRPASVPQTDSVSRVRAPGPHVQLNIPLPYVEESMPSPPVLEVDTIPSKKVTPTPEPFLATANPPSYDPTVVDYDSLTAFEPIPTVKLVDKPKQPKPEATKPTATTPVRKSVATRTGKPRMPIAPGTKPKEPVAPRKLFSERPAPTLQKIKAAQRSTEQHTEEQQQVQEERRPAVTTRQYVADSIARLDDRTPKVRADDMEEDDYADTLGFDNLEDHDFEDMDEFDLFLDTQRASLQLAQANVEHQAIVNSIVLDHIRLKDNMVKQSQFTKQLDNIGSAPAQQAPDFYKHLDLTEEEKRIVHQDPVKLPPSEQPVEAASHLPLNSFLALQKQSQHALHMISQVGVTVPGELADAGFALPRDEVKRLVRLENDKGKDGLREDEDENYDEGNEESEVEFDEVPKTLRVAEADFVDVHPLRLGLVAAKGHGNLNWAGASPVPPSQLSKNVTKFSPATQVQLFTAQNSYMNTSMKNRIADIVRTATAAA